MPAIPPFSVDNYNGAPHRPVEIRKKLYVSKLSKLITNRIPSWVGRLLGLAVARAAPRHSKTHWAGGGCGSELVRTDDNFFKTLAEKYIFLKNLQQFLRLYIRVIVRSAQPRSKLYKLRVFYRLTTWRTLLPFRGRDLSIRCLLLAIRRFSIREP